jgi:hypothetical protein
MKKKCNVMLVRKIYNAMLVCLADHFILHCSFARSVWLKMADWTQNLLQQPADGVANHGLVAETTCSSAKEGKKD